MNPAPMLSMYVLTGVFTGIISLIGLTKYSPSLTASDRAMYSACSVLEVDTVACLETRKLRREPL
eukprot:143474-Prorocentrum_minimum.AAC.1